jgi:acyl carrier protein
MELKTFIENFANQFDDTEISEFKAETNFRELDEWSSLTALAVMNMIGKKYEVKITADDMRSVSTICELFDFVQKRS